MKLQEHTAYINTRKVSSIVWDISRDWDKNTLMTVGNQLIRAADSISANIAEGWNRYTKKDKINFFIIARGSVGETQDWIEKAFGRKLITLDLYRELIKLILALPREINGLIKSCNNNLSH